MWFSIFLPILEEMPNKGTVIVFRRLHFHHFWKKYQTWQKKTPEILQFNKFCSYWNVCGIPLDPFLWVYPQTKVGGSVYLTVLGLHCHITFLCALGEPEFSSNSFKIHTLLCIAWTNVGCQLIFGTTWFHLWPLGADFVFLVWLVSQQSSSNNLTSSIHPSIHPSVHPLAGVIEIEATLPRGPISHL